MRRKNPAPNSQVIVKWLSEYRDQHGFPPSRREVAAQFGMGLDTAQRSIEALVDEGLLEVKPGIPRGMNITGAGLKLVSDPMENMS